MAPAAASARGARRRYVPQGASGDGNAARSRPDLPLRYRGDQPVPQQTRSHRNPSGQPRGEPTRPPRDEPPNLELLMPSPRELNTVLFVSVDNMMKLILRIGIERFVTQLVAYTE